MAREGYFGENSVKPSFLPSKKSDFAGYGQLRSAEQSAANLSPANQENSGELEKLEQAPSFYTGSGKNSHSSFFSNKKKSGFRFSSKRAPLYVSLLLLMFGGFSILSSNTLLGPHISALTTASTNVGRAAITKVEGTILSYLSKKNLIPQSLQKRFLKNGATKVDAGNIEFKGKTFSGDDIARSLEDDLDFADLANKSTYSKVLDFHDNSANNTYNDLMQSRNIFNDFKTTGDDDTDLENYKALREEYAGGDTANIKLNTAEDGQKIDSDTGEVELDENGNPITERRATSGDVNTSSADGPDATSKASTFVAGAAAKVASGLNVACAGWQVGNMIAIAVSAAELYQSINYFLNTIESISKMMAGEGSQSGINQVLNFFTTSTTQTVVNPATGQEISVTGSPLESEWARVVLGGVTANSNNTVLYSFERLSRTALSILGAAFTSKTAATTCNVSRAAAAAISLGSIATGGIISVVVGGLINTVLAVGIQVAISGALSVFIPTVARAIFSNAYTQYESGIPGGEEFGRGAMAANSRISRSASALMPASAEKNVAYQRIQSEVIAREAAIDRKNRSPLDASSPNTFLGSILTKFAFVPAFNNTSLLASLTSGDLFSAVSTIANTTATSIGNAAFASDDFENYLTTYGDCPNKADIGSVGEMYCNDLLAADPSILEMDPEDPTYLSVIAPSLETDEQGNEKIIEGSPLAQFISYAVNRDSSFGTYDANIASSCEISFGVVGDNLPVISDILDIVNAFRNNNCADIASGARYVYSDNNPYWDSEIKYYQYYVIKNRVLDRLDYFSEQNTANPVAVYQESYRATHPLDTSRAGTLARISGLTKSDAETVLALTDYYQALAEYDPDSTYHFVKTTTTEFDLQTIASDSTTPRTLIFQLINSKHYYGRREVATV